MKIIAISDLHGNLPEITEKANLLIIAGDISPLKIQFKTREMKAWLINQFLDWVEKAPVEKVILVAGNHDSWFERAYEDLKVDLQRRSNYKLIYLENDIVFYNDETGKEYSIYGTPYCHMYGNWPFMREDEYMEEAFRDIPEYVDILVTHDAPYGCSDICYQRQDYEHKGNVPLRDTILEKSPKLVLHGHLHSSNHNEEILGKSKVYNVSILDENYVETYEPLILEI